MLVIGFVHVAIQAGLAVGALQLQSGVRNVVAVDEEVIQLALDFPALR